MTDTIGRQPDRRFRGFFASVYRANDGDFTNGGVSRNHDTVFIVDASGPDFIVPPDVPLLTTRVLGGAWNAAQLERPEGAVGPMFGGNFAYTTDSRFRKAFGGPLPIHDRFETSGQYASH